MFLFNSYRSKDLFNFNTLLRWQFLHFFAARYFNYSNVSLGIPWSVIKKEPTYPHPRTLTLYSNKLHSTYTHRCDMKWKYFRDWNNIMISFQTSFFHAFAQFCVCLYAVTPNVVALSLFFSSIQAFINWIRHYNMWFFLFAKWNSFHFSGKQTHRVDDDDRNRDFFFQIKFSCGNIFFPQW